MKNFKAGKLLLKIAKGHEAASLCRKITSLRLKLFLEAL